MSRIRLVSIFLQPGKCFRRLCHTCIPASRFSCRRGRVHRAPQRCRLIRCRYPDRTVQYICKDAKHQWILFRNPSAHDHFVYLCSGLHELFHDHTRTICGRFDQGTVDLFRLCLKCHAGQHTGQVSVHIRRFVSVPPVKREKTRRSGLQRGCLF